MPDQDFTNREIVLMFEQIKTELSHIKEQTTKTNGRLLKAEDKLDGLSSFQTRVMTIWGIATFVIVTAVNRLL